VAWDKGEQINSIPDAVGTAMRRYLDGEIDKQYPQQKSLSELEAESRERRGGGDDAAADADEHERLRQSETDGGAALGTADAGPTVSDPDAPTGQSDATQDLLDAGESPECPECGNMTLYFSEGCKTCESCGWSEC
jgi:ribonucleoside-diphosphate reductase alpha chain